MPARPSWRTLLVACLAFSLAVGGVAGGTATATDSPSPSVATADRPVVEFTRIVQQRRGEPSDEVAVVFQYDLPDSVLSFHVSEVALGDGASVVASEGFERAGTGNWTWTESTRRPSLTVRYHLPTARLTSGGRGTAGDGWAFLRLPTPHHSGRATGQQPTFAYDARVDGPGVASDTYAFAGNYTAYDRTVVNRTVRLVVPEAAQPSNPPATLLGFVGATSDRLRVGGRDPLVTGYVVPSADRRVSPRGASRGDSFYVADRPGRDAGVTYAHEYTHTRQAFDADPSARWLYEGTASFYGIVLRAHAANWTEEKVYDRTSGSASGTLADPSTWSALTPYAEGRQFLAHLNLRLRRATDGQVTLTAVVRNLNVEDRRVTHSDVVETIGTYDRGTAAWANRTLRSDGDLDAPRDPAAYVFAGSDPDADGLNASVEAEFGSSAFATDTDGDGLPDDREFALGTDPTDSDTDDDGVRDGRDECPTEPGDPPDGCPATPTVTPSPVPTTPASPTGEDGATTGADGPVRPAPVLALVVAALLGRTLARER